MKTIEYMGLKFVDDEYFRNQVGLDVDSYLYAIMHHHELNGVVKQYRNRDILTNFEFIKKGNIYYCKELNNLSEVLNFRLEIEKILKPNSIFVVMLFSPSDSNKPYKLSFTTIDNAIEFCRRLINYEIINFLDKSEKLFK